MALIKVWISFLPHHAVSKKQYIKGVVCPLFGCCSCGKPTKPTLPHGSGCAPTTQVTKEFTDCHRGETPHYKHGNWIWLSSRDRCILEGCRKQDHRYIGLFKILKFINEVEYKLNLRCHRCLAPPFHISCLKPLAPITQSTMRPPKTAAF